MQDSAFFSSYNKPILENYITSYTTYNSIPCNDVNRERIAKESQKKNDDISDGQYEMSRRPGRLECHPVAVNIQQVTVNEKPFILPLLHRIDFFEMLKKLIRASLPSVTE